jgi:hypothetical protein
MKGTVTDVAPTAKVAATVGYSTSTKKAILNPGRPLVRGATYSARVTTEAEDFVGGPLVGIKVWGFTVRR